MSIKVGQVYASTHSGDVFRGQRQRRVVVSLDLTGDSPGPSVWLHTEGRTGKPSRVSLRSPQSRTIPGHRLVEDVPPDIVLEVHGWHTCCGSCGYGGGGWADSPANKSLPILTADSPHCHGCGRTFTHRLTVPTGERAALLEPRPC